MSIKIIIADDHAVVIEGIKAVLEKAAKDIMISGETSDGKELLELARKNPADVYLLDIAMPSLNGIDAAGKLLRMDKAAKIIFLSMYNDRVMVEKALRTGARGYLLKESAAEEIVKAVREVNYGGYYLSAGISGILLDCLTARPQDKFKTESYDRLTLKEREIVQLIGEGLANKDVARKLRISINTVHAHRNNIARKLNIHKQTELVRYAIKEKISKL